MWVDDIWVWVHGGLFVCGVECVGVRRKYIGFIMFVRSECVGCSDLSPGVVLCGERKCVCLCLVWV